MSDLERELRKVFEREGRNLDLPHPSAIPATVGARVRRRQMTMVLCSALLLAGISIGAVSLARVLSFTPPDRVGQPPVGPSPTDVGSPPTGRRIVLASGEANGQEWRFFVRRAEDWCIGEVFDRGSGESCGFDVPPKDLGISTSGSPDGPMFLKGVVSKEVVRIEVGLADGTVRRPEVLEPSPELGVPFNAFIIVLPEDASGEVRVFDGDGGWLQSVRFGSPRAGGRTSIGEGERRAIRSIVRFARVPSPERFAAIPLADEVWLGLGAELRERHPAAVLADPAAWTVEARLFRAYVGPFSALEPLADPDPLRVVVGPHEHCASPPVLPPEEVAELTRVSVQPRRGSIDTCLRWFTVDAFLDGEGRIVAVTLDLWEA